MHTKLCDRLGIEFPIFAFTHCRDVVAAVSQGGRLRRARRGRLQRPSSSRSSASGSTSTSATSPYGVDIVIPGKYEGMGEIDPKKLEEQLAKMIPHQHREFAAKLLADHGVPELPRDEKRPRAARLDGRHRDAAGRRRAEAPEGEADRERARHAAEGRDRPHPRERAGWWPRSAAAPTRRVRTRRRASTSSSRRAPRAAATPARSAAWCCGRR